MSLRMPIPKATREQLNGDPWMHTCIINNEECDGRVEWQHFFTYAGKRQSEIYGILPLCYAHHKRQAEIIPQQAEAMRGRIWYFNKEEEFRTKYPKSSLLKVL